MSKKASKKEDTISQIKKEEDKIKKETKKEEEVEHSEDEEENQNVIKEQTVQKADKPKNLKELMGSMGDAKPKPKKKTNKPQKKYEEPGKLTFYNTKGTNNADKIDNEARNKNNLEKKVYKNTKGLDAAAKDNLKIKPTKDYLEKDSEKQYNEEAQNVAKPQFTSGVKEGDENFVELNKNEDVSNISIIFINIVILCL